VVVVHPLAGGVEVFVGSHGGRAGLHHLGSRGMLGGADPAGPQDPDHGALSCDDHAAVPSVCACLLHRQPGPSRLPASGRPPWETCWSRRPQGPTWDDWRRDLGLPASELGIAADSIIDPGGEGPRIWFHVVPEAN
jgi:hypothetical protein